MGGGTQIGKHHHRGIVAQHMRMVSIGADRPTSPRMAAIEPKIAVVL